MAVCSQSHALQQSSDAAALCACLQASACGSCAARKSMGAAGAQGAPGSQVSAHKDVLLLFVIRRALKPGNGLFAAVQWHVACKSATHRRLSS